MRGEVYELLAPCGARGHEQTVSRYAVVVQSHLLPLSTWLVAPTSTSARAATFRPEVAVGGRTTRVLVEQTAAVDPPRLGAGIAHLTFGELREIDAALRLFSCFVGAGNRPQQTVRVIYDPVYFAGCARRV